MIKELILAIGLGALLGFGLTGGYIAIKRDSHPKDSTTPALTPTSLPPQASTGTNTTPNPSVTPEDSSNKQSTITIESPEDKSILTDSALTVKGTANPKSRIVITSATGDYFGTSDDSGSFSINIELESGPNILEINSIDPDDTQTSTQLFVTYSTAKI